MNNLEELTRIHISPSQRNNNLTINNGDHAHFQIEDEQLKNVDWFVQIKTKINQLIYYAIQLVTRCPLTPHVNLIAC